MGKGDSTSAAQDTASPPARKQATASPPARKQATASPPARKQAVVIIHGMGEPVPMDTMRGFVDAVWAKDASLSPRLQDDPKQYPCDCDAKNPYWIVPDTRTGSLELNRITTPIYRVGPDKGQALPTRTDFYEFYWSDIMEGTTFEHVRAWMMGLLFRWPHQVPPRVFFAWLLLWVLVVFTVVLAVGGATQFLPTGADQVDQLSNDNWPLQRIAACLELDRPAMTSCILPWIVGWVLTAVVVASAIFILIGRLRRAFAGQENREPQWTDWFMAVVMPLLSGILAAVLFPWDRVFTLAYVMLGLSALLGFFIQSFLVPYFGDVARYVRAAPNTIAKRAEVRERGLELLRALHGRSGDDNQEGDHADRYDRIVIVGHSLGSIIAYDLLNHFWAEAGPTRLNPPGPAAIECMEKLDAFLKKPRAAAVGSLNTPDTFLNDLRDHQRSVFKELARKEHGNGWRISDFVTLGSPLSHANFLISRDDAMLEERILDRQAPTCPPRLDESTPSILYPPAEAGKTVQRYAHHSAVFAAVRWTNIFDPHPTGLRLYRGDLISGPVNGLLGDGIKDIPVEMTRRFLWKRVSRVFTHTQYWSLDAESEDPALVGKALKQGECELCARRRYHLNALREAVQLADPTVASTAEPN